MGVARLKGVLLSTLVITSIIALAIPLISTGTVHAALTPHDPIYINGNDNFTPANGVTSGSGTESDPYIIENWDISAENAHGIEIRNTTAHFVIRNVYVHGGWAPSDGVIILSPEASAQTASGSYFGIYLDNVVNGRIENVHAKNNYRSIYLYSSLNNLISNSLVRNNDYGIHLDFSDNNLISNNIAENGSTGSIRIYSSSNNVVDNNLVENSIYGIRLAGSTWNNIIKNNLVRNNSLGIYDEASGNNVIDNNLAENNTPYGIYLNFSANNLVSNNLVRNNSSFGIYLGHSPNNRIDNNIVRNNYDGISLGVSANNTIINNLVEKNYRGLYLYNKSDNNLISNNFIENNDYGFKLWYYSDKNLIYHNNFMNNTIQAYDDGSNYWDNGYPSGGNYWSDYTGADNFRGENQDQPGRDGIGDTPYVIPGDNNRDRYPLMSHARSVYVSISPRYQSGPPKENLAYIVSVMNIGAENYNYALNAWDTGGWNPTLSENLLENVNPGENRIIMLTVTVPENATSFTQDDILVTATSVENAEVIASGICIAQVPGKAEFRLITLFKVSLDVYLYLGQGSKLVVKFYTYDGVFENENVIHENFALPWHVEENENVPHPSGLPVEIVRLVLTTDNTEEVISTVASFTATKSVLTSRYLAIKIEYVKPGADKPALATEYLKIKSQYINASS